METPNTPKETPTYADLFQQLQRTQRELTDKQLLLDRVSALGERNARYLNEALKTTRQLISDALIENDSFLEDHDAEIQQLISLGMEDFTRKISVYATYSVTLEMELTVPHDFDESDLDFNMKEDADIFEGELFDSSVVDVDDMDVRVTMRDFKVQENN